MNRSGLEKSKALLLIAIIWIAAIIIIAGIVLFYPQHRTTCEVLNGHKICSVCPVNDVNATALSCNGSSVK